MERDFTACKSWILVHRNEYICVKSKGKMEVFGIILVLGIVFLSLWGRSQLSAKTQFYVSMSSAILLTFMLVLQKADLSWSVIILLVVFSSVYAQFKSFKKEQENQVHL